MESSFNFCGDVYVFYLVGGRVFCWRGLCWKMWILRVWV